ncbi:hypothetical protein [Mycolicibacterium fortuitum]|uniref:hypothetical protein n=1 Tax=Mycolicibacterium fortuitum TaxID=1766 RepID=UPI00260E7FD5|nr:hypothetical protein [Mycolicibacterium fortuitum]
MDIVDQIIAAAKLDKPWTWGARPPRGSDDGHLHLSRQQWDRVQAIYPTRPETLPCGVGHLRQADIATRA